MVRGECPSAHRLAPAEGLPPDSLPKVMELPKDTEALKATVILVVLLAHPDMERKALQAAEAEAVAEAGRSRSELRRSMTSLSNLASSTAICTCPSLMSLVM